MVKAPSASRPKKAKPITRSIEELKVAHRAYMLRTCKPDMSSYGGFKWPKSGLVECPDWNAAPVCGNGLHGLLWGGGNASLLNWDEGAPFLVVGIDEWVDACGKVKAPRGEVVYCGDLRGAADLLVALGADTAKCVGSTATAGYAGTATAGEDGAICIHFWDEKKRTLRLRISMVGENGIEANKAYRLDGDKFVPATNAEPKP